MDPLICLSLWQTPSSFRSRIKRRSPTCIVSLTYHSCSIPSHQLSLENTCGQVSGLFHIQKLQFMSIFPIKLLNLSVHLLLSFFPDNIYQHFLPTIPLWETLKIHNIWITPQSELNEKMTKEFQQEFLISLADQHANYLDGVSFISSKLQLKHPEPTLFTYICPPVRLRASPHYNEIKIRVIYQCSLNLPTKNTKYAQTWKSLWEYYKSTTSQILSSIPTFTQPPLILF